MQKCYGKKIIQYLQKKKNEDSLYCYALKKEINEDNKYNICFEITTSPNDVINKKIVQLYKIVLCFNFLYNIYNIFIKNKRDEKLLSNGFQYFQGQTKFINFKLPLIIILITNGNISDFFQIKDIIKIKRSEIKEEKKAYNYSNEKNDVNINTKNEKIFENEKKENDVTKKEEKNENIVEKEENIFGNEKEENTIIEMKKDGKNILEKVKKDENILENDTNYNPVQLLDKINTEFNIYFSYCKKYDDVEIKEMNNQMNKLKIEHKEAIDKLNLENKSINNKLEEMYLIIKELRTKLEYFEK